MRYPEVVHVNIPTCFHALITSTTIKPNTVDKVESFNTCTKYCQNLSQQITTERTLNIESTAYHSYISYSQTDEISPTNLTTPYPVGRLLFESHEPHTLLVYWGKSLTTF